MRLLFLLPFAPRRDVANGGARVLTQFLTEISLRHKVAILYFREADEPGADLFFHERCEWVEEVVRPASKKSLLARLTRDRCDVLFIDQRDNVFGASRRDWTAANHTCQAGDGFHRFRVMGVQAA